MQTTSSDATEKPMAQGASAKAPDSDKREQPKRNPRDTATLEARRVALAVGLSNAVGVLMRDPVFKNLRLSDLEWLVLPPLVAGQCRVAQHPISPPGAKDDTTQVLVPVGVALWAMVTPEVDKRLSETLDQAPTLAPADWTAGDIPWLIVAAGDRRAMPRFLKELAKSVFAGKQVKIRVSGPDGKPVVKTLGAG